MNPTVSTFNIPFFFTKNHKKVKYFFQFFLYTNASVIDTLSFSLYIHARVSTVLYESKLCAHYRIPIGGRDTTHATDPGSLRSGNSVVIIFGLSPNLCYYIVLGPRVLPNGT